MLASRAKRMEEKGEGKQGIRTHFILIDHFAEEHDGGRKGLET